MKYNSSTLYNWLSDDSCSKTQLHIYAVESEEEYLELSAMLDEGKADEILKRLSYHSDKVPIECVAGSEFTSYDCKLIGDFLVVEETVTVDC